MGKLLYAFPIPKKIPTNLKIQKKSAKIRIHIKETLKNFEKNVEVLDSFIFYLNLKA